MTVRAGFTAPMLGKKLVSTDVQVVQLVGLAVHVEHRGGRVGAEPAGARPGARRRRSGCPCSCRSSCRSTWCSARPDVVEDRPQLVVQAVGLLVVGRCVGQADVPVAVDGDPVVRLGARPRWSARSRPRAGRPRPAPPRGELGQLGLLALHRHRVGLAEHLDVAQRPLRGRRPRGRSRSGRGSSGRPCRCPRRPAPRRPCCCGTCSCGRPGPSRWPGPFGCRSLAGPEQDPGACWPPRRRPRRCRRRRSRARRPRRPPRRSPHRRPGRSPAASTSALTSRVTFGRSSSGRTAMASASDLACTRHG